MVPAASTADPPATMVSTHLVRAVRAKPLEKWRWERWIEMVKVTAKCLFNIVNFQLFCKIPSYSYTHVPFIARISCFTWVLTQIFFLPPFLLKLLVFYSVFTSAYTTDWQESLFNSFICCFFLYCLCPMRPYQTYNTVYITCHLFKYFHCI